MNRWLLMNCFVWALALSGAAQVGTTSRVSLSSAGVEGNNNSGNPPYGLAISADGRFIAYYSDADNLVLGDTNGYADVFVHDRLAGQTTRVSVSSSGQQGNGSSYGASLSADGRFVAFYSHASNLVPGDTNGYPDVFVHDRLLGQTTSEGRQGNEISMNPAISADGRFVAFISWDHTLVPGGVNNSSHIFVHDRQNGKTSRVSVSSSGQQANSDSFGAAISADGRFVAFYSHAGNLVPGDTNHVQDVFLHDRYTGQTSRVSVASGGQQANGPSFEPSISADGRFVTFHSGASNLVPGDTNGFDDVFVHDRQSRQTSRVSVSSSGAQANGDCGSPTISAGGRFISFTSQADNLVAEDTNLAWDIFVHDRQTGQTSRPRSPQPVCKETVEVTPPS